MNNYPLLRQVMKATSVSQPKLAELIGRSKSYVEAQFQQRGNGFTIKEMEMLLKHWKIDRTWMPFLFDEYGRDYDVAIEQLYRPFKECAVERTER